MEPKYIKEEDPIANVLNDNDEFLYRMNLVATYEKLINLCKDDPDVVDVLRFLRQREIVHFQRFGEALRNVQDKLAKTNCYMSKPDC